MFNDASPPLLRLLVAQKRENRGGPGGPARHLKQLKELKDTSTSHHIQGSKQSHNKLKKGKAPGLNRVTPEALKATNPTITSRNTRICIRFFQGKVPLFVSGVFFV